MIKRLLIAFSAIAMLLATSCKDDDDYDIFLLSASELTFGCNVDSVLMCVFATGSQNWTMEIVPSDDNDEMWCSFDRNGTEFTMTGTGSSDYIYLYSKANYEKFDKELTLQLTDNSTSYGTVECDLVLSAITITITADTVHYIPRTTGVTNIALSSNADVSTIYNDNSWFDIAIDNNTSIVVTVTEDNDDTFTRWGEFTITGYFLEEPDSIASLTVQLIQDGTTTMASDSLALLTVVSDLFEWDRTQSVSTWSGVEVGYAMTSSGYSRHVIGINLADKGLETMPDLSPLNYIESLRLNNNDISGDIPEYIFRFRNMKLLWLGNNAKLTGSIPTSISDMSKLVNLSIVNTEISGSIPTELAELENLTSVQLSGNKLTGTIPAEFGANRYLNTLMLNGNYLEGAVPAELKSNINWYYWEPDTYIFPQRDGVVLELE